MKVFYKTRATATGGRSGTSALDDGSLSLEMAQPGTGKAGANPEQLFAMGYAACFDSAMSLVAKQMGLDASGSQTAVEVGIGQSPAGGYMLDLDIYISVPALSEAEAQKLVEATHQVCPYSHATRGNIDVRLHVSN